MGGGQPLRRGDQGLSPVAGAAAEESGGAGAPGALPGQDKGRRRAKPSRCSPRSSTKRDRRACWRCRSSAIWRCSRATSPAPSMPTTSCSPKRRRNVDARMALLDAFKGLSDGGDEKARARGMELAQKLKTEPQGRRRRSSVTPRSWSRCSSTATPPRISPTANACCHGRSQGRRGRARARRRQARRSRGGAVPARARLRQSRRRQEGRRAQGVEEGDARQGSGAGARRRRLRRRRPRRGDQAAQGRGHARRVVSGGLLPARVRLQGAGRRRRRRATRGRRRRASIPRASSASGRRPSCRCSPATSTRSPRGR